MSATVEKYLARYAVPEARLPLRLPTAYEHVLVLPALGESVGFLEGVRSALRGTDGSEAPGRRLLVLVVNSAPETAEPLCARNHELLEELTVRARAREFLQREPPIQWLDLEGFDAVVVDRSSPGYQLPPRQGVGLARKLGADLALGLHARGQLRATGFGSTDADARLPVEYFSTGERALGTARAAIFPFSHGPSEDALVTRATAAYELSLRYYVLGLDHAGSSYAYHSLGSTLYVGFEAYAQVRGFPKRRAGEDFYLLDKLAKLGAVRRLEAPCIQIDARISTRVPFGTGPGVQRLLMAALGPEGLTLYAPRCFAVLGEVLASFSELAETRDVEGMRTGLAARLKEGTVPEGQVVLAHLDALGMPEMLREALAQAKNSVQLSRRLRVWFDALRSLRLIHALRDHCHPSLPWREALASAPFACVDTASLESSVAALRQLEQRLAPSIGALRGPAD
ncbi:MAG TPA: hypothetical protein VNN80_10250 [Polyangiaceae bacterium]|nr:hypothetical protein [Polyangiaceae bacterium]